MVEGGRSDSSVALSTGHKNPNPLKRFQNLRGGEGIIQQGGIFDGTSGTDSKIRRCESDNGNVLDSNVCNVPSTIGHVSGSTDNVTINYFGPSCKP